MLSFSSGGRSLVHSQTTLFCSADIFNGLNRGKMLHWQNLPTTKLFRLEHRGVNCKEGPKDVMIVNDWVIIAEEICCR